MCNNSLFSKFFHVRELSYRIGIGEIFFTYMLCVRYRDFLYLSACMPCISYSNFIFFPGSCIIHDLKIIFSVGLHEISLRMIIYSQKYLKQNNSVTHFWEYYDDNASCGIISTYNMAC